MSAVQTSDELQTFRQLGRQQPAAVEALRTPAVIEKFRNVSYNPMSSSPQDLIRRSDEDIKLLVEAAALIGFQPQ